MVIFHINKRGPIHHREVLVEESFRLIVGERKDNPAKQYWDLVIAMIVVQCGEHQDLYFTSKKE